MRTKYYRQDNRIVRCSDLKIFKNTEEFLEDEIKDLERQLAEIDGILRKVEGVLSHSEDIRFKDLDALLIIKEYRNKQLKR